MDLTPDQAAGAVERHDCPKCEASAGSPYRSPRRAGWPDGQAPAGRGTARPRAGDRYASRSQDPAGLLAGDVTLHPRGLVIAVLTGKTRTASTEAILRRFTRNASHPTYAAMLEVGRAQKTIFVARYLRLRDLQREIEEGLNVMESSNGANSVIAYGKGGEIASNRRAEQEMFVLSLRILQSAPVYVNTLMLQDILGEPEWADLLTPADRRGLTPLFWSHVRPSGEVNLDMGARLSLAVTSVPEPRAPADQTARSTVENI
ncbi:Tn3 family transposase [Streptomyces sp. NPDC002671]